MGLGGALSRASGAVGGYSALRLSVARGVYRLQPVSAFNPAHEETHKAWSVTVSGLDAFVFVTPEYNYGMPPSLINALDYLYVEWNYKAAGFVSYGGGRGVQMAKQTLTTLKMVPIFESVTIPFFMQAMDRESGTFKGGEQYEKAATVMLNELQRWTAALAALRS